MEDLEVKIFENYKDLDQYCEYDLDIIKDMNANILKILLHLSMNCKEKTDYIKDYNSKNNVGVSISNYLNKWGYSRELLKSVVIWLR